MILKGRLYAITDERLLARRVFLEKVREAVAAGVGVVQLREKATRLRDRAALGRELVSLAHRLGARVVVNDDPALARRIGADGVHLGKADPPIEAARSLLGASAVIGVSCYGDVRRALEMQRRGASYVSFGAFYPSPTKPREPLVPLSVLKRAKRVLSVPVVAIGGVAPGNAASLIAAGADCLAVVSSLFAADDPGKAVERMRRFLGGDGR